MAMGAIKSATQRKKNLNAEERSAKHPKLRTQFEELLALVENEGAAVQRADQAEELVDL